MSSASPVPESVAVSFFQPDYMTVHYKASKPRYLDAATVASRISKAEGLQSELLKQKIYSLDVLLNQYPAELRETKVAEINGQIDAGLPLVNISQELSHDLLTQLRAKVALSPEIRSQEAMYILRNTIARINNPDEAYGERLAVFSRAYPDQGERRSFFNTIDIQAQMTATKLLDASTTEWAIQQRFETGYVRESSIMPVSMHSLSHDIDRTVRFMNEELERWEKFPSDQFASLSESSTPADLADAMLSNEAFKKYSKLSKDELISVLVNYNQSTDGLYSATYQSPRYGDDGRLFKGVGTHRVILNRDSGGPRLSVHNVLLGCEVMGADIDFYPVKVGSSTTFRPVEGVGLVVSDFNIFAFDQAWEGHYLAGQIMSGPHVVKESVKRERLPSSGSDEYLAITRPLVADTVMAGEKAADRSAQARMEAVADQSSSSPALGKDSPSPATPSASSATAFGSDVSAGKPTQGGRRNSTVVWPQGQGGASSHDAGVRSGSHGSASGEAPDPTSD